MKYNGGYDWFKTTKTNPDGCSSTTYEESKVYDIIAATVLIKIRKSIAAMYVKR